MLFNSIQYAFFLPIVFILYWAIPKHFRWGILLVSSYYFYMNWNPKYVVLILFTTLISFLCALMIEKTKNIKLKKVYIAVTLIVSLGVLFVFKYFNFFMDSLYVLLTNMGFHVHTITLKLLLPVGISFYTFQTLSYVIDVYRGDVSAEHHFGKYAAFISFFPQLVAGPIERTSNLLPQINKPNDFSYKKAAYGMKLMAWGFFKKIIISDTFAIYVDNVYNNLSAYTGFSLVIATVLFAVQIYCDFSGYSDIAIGSANLFNIDLMQNFRSPYFSASIKEFWTRWHISLSTWFRDYLYIPLGGNRCGKLRHYSNLIITFLVSGLWHGASWTFVLWGFIHGVGQVVENLFSSGKKKNIEHKHNLRWLCSVIFIFVFCNFTWIFFRVSDIREAGYIFKNIFSGISAPLLYLKSGFTAMGIWLYEIESIIIMLVVLFAFDYFNLKTDVIEKISTLNIFTRWIIYLAFAILTLIMYPSVYGGQFIYFQF